VCLDRTSNCVTHRQCDVHRFQSKIGGFDYIQSSISVNNNYDYSLSVAVRLRREAPKIELKEEGQLLDALIGMWASHTVQ
jgi:hypothetical protein